MPRIFKTADYESSLDLKISLSEALPPDHLARFITHHRQDAYTALTWLPSVTSAVSMRAIAHGVAHPMRQNCSLPYNFTDPESWIMKNSSNDGFEVYRFVLHF